ncbi:MAG: tRNA uracil 4-sulfurtransferase ThiI, partial [Candidatus Hydrothermarchaeales archaeon]
RRIEGQLVRNIKSAVDRDITREFGRIFVDSDSREDAERIAKVFGVVSTSLTVKTSSDMGGLVARGAEYAKNRIKHDNTFAVRARRIGNQGYRSGDVASNLGAAVSEATGARVDLDNPNTTIYVEVREDDAYIFDEVIQGVGGLPLGTQGTAIALVSGGIDSPVAAWMMMKRGMDIVALFMDPSPLVDERTIARARETIRKLAGWKGAEIKTYIAPYGNVLLQLLKASDHSLGCILCKRMMYRVGEGLAKKEGAKALITGENLGQVASQTTDNLAVIDATTSLPVFRPLIGMDKNEIIDLAKKIDTYEASIAPANCCLGPPRHPATRATCKRVEEAEASLAISEFTAGILEDTKVEVIK